MATPQPPNGAAASPSPSTYPYKRASRKGAPRRFTCDYDGCEKKYSRQEHLQRHQLNHKPKEIYKCDEIGCEQKFVRADLLARHKKRHSASYNPRHRVPSFGSLKDTSAPGSGSSAFSPTSGGNAAISPTAANIGLSPSSRCEALSPPVSRHAAFSPPSKNTVLSPTAPSSSGADMRPRYASVPRDAAILLTPDSSTLPAPPLVHASASSQMNHTPSWMTIPDIGSVNIVRAKTYSYPRESQSSSMQPAVLTYDNDYPSSDRECHFGAWLFDSGENLPFLELGLESTLNSDLHYDESLTSSSRSQFDTPPRITESDDMLSEYRLNEIVQWLRLLHQRYPKVEELAALVYDSGFWHSLDLEMMRDCIHEYWEHVAPRLPIVHQPTFSCNRCSIYLLMVMIALGAASLRSRDTTGTLLDYGRFADLIIAWARWDILTEASPPVSLCAAQSLLLLEFYEKMYSSRSLHERAHIYHTSALTLLRRGSPLIGRSGSESPPEEHPSSDSQGIGMDSRTAWVRWADTEAMHRVVFAAFMLDTLHAAMFGHAADMTPHEIRLPLPCDDSLWTAPTPEVARQLESNLRMYGVKSVSFLDGLKKALHGKEVPTVPFGRMIIMSGLLNVGWHLSHRETNLKWLDLATTPTEIQERWKQTLLKAFDLWKESFDVAQGSAESPALDGWNSQFSGFNGPIQSPAVLYHLAHISLHVDIVDCQVYAGAKRLLGRKITTRDYKNVVSRMKTWAHLPSTRHAVLHAVRLLYRVLVEPRRSSANERDRIGDRTDKIILPPIEALTYTCRNEPDPHRPWIMYYAALGIWSYVMALNWRQHAQYDMHAHYDSAVAPQYHVPSAVPLMATSARMPPKPMPVDYRRINSYLAHIANLPELNETDTATLADGLPDLLDALRSIFSEAHSELLREAHERLKVCKDILLGTAG